MALTESSLRRTIREEAMMMKEGPYRQRSDRDRGTHWDTSRDADRLGRGDKDDFGGDDFDIEYSGGDVEDDEGTEGEHPWR